MKVELEKPKIGALAPWFGGKRTLGSQIAAEFGSHSAYWGLCCGSLAVEFAKEPCTMETCVDLHGDLTNLAFVLQQKPLAEDLYGRLERTLLSRELFLQSAQVIRTEAAPAGDAPADVDRAYHYMVVSWFGRNGVAGTSSYNAGFCVRYTKNGGHAAKRFRSAVESIPWWHERLSNITILRENTFDMAARIEDATRTVVYCDPPYVAKGAKYVHDFTPDDHTTLFNLLNRFKKTRVVVSYYDHPLIRELYKDWTWRFLDATKAMVNQGMRDKGGSTKAPEVLLINERPTDSLF
jgi:DNA adenine methylase